MPPYEAILAAQCPPRLSTDTLIQQALRSSATAGPKSLGRSLFAVFVAAIVFLAHSSYLQSCDPAQSPISRSLRSEGKVRHRARIGQAQALRERSRLLDAVIVNPFGTQTVHLLGSSPRQPRSSARQGPLPVSSHYLRWLFCMRQMAGLADSDAGHPSLGVSICACLFEEAATPSTGLQNNQGMTTDRHPASLFVRGHDLEDLPLCLTRQLGCTSASRCTWKDASSGTDDSCIISVRQRLTAIPY